MTFATEVAADSPYLWWDTRQASGTSQPDRSGNSRVGTIHGSPTKNAITGMIFDNSATGDDQWIQGPTIGPTNPVTSFTFEVVVQRDQTKQNSSTSNVPFTLDDVGQVGTTGLIWYDTGSSPAGFGYFPRIFYVRSDGAAPIPMDSPYVQDDRICHVAGTFDGSTLSLYLDGVLVNSGSFSPTDAQYVTAETFMVGTDLGGLGHGFGGIIRHAIFYQSCLNATRIGVHASKCKIDDVPASPATSTNDFPTEVTADSPYLWWDTRQISGASQPDRSMNGRTGIVTGSPSVDTDLGATFDNTGTGDDEYITATATTPNNTTFSAFTFEALITYTSGGSALLGFDDNPSEISYSIMYPQSSATLGRKTIGMSYNMSNGSNRNISDPFSGLKINDGAVHHLAIVNDGTNNFIYIDGVRTEPPDAPAAGGLKITHDALFTLANDQCACGDGYSGIIRHGIFYAHDLDADRIAVHAWAAFTNDTPGSGPPVPTCSTVTPNSGYTSGGESVVLAGTGFTDASEVDFGTTPAAGFTVDSDSQITATTPAHDEGTVNVTVTTPGGTSA